MKKKKYIIVELLLMIMLIACADTSENNSTKKEQEEKELIEDTTTLTTHKTIYKEQIDSETGMKYIEGELDALYDVMNINEEYVNLEYIIKTNVDGTDIYFHLYTRGIERIYENEEAKSETPLGKRIKVEYEGELKFEKYWESDNLESYTIENPIRIIYME